MDLVDEQDVTFVECGQDRGEVPCALDGRAARVPDVDPELARDDRGQRRLAEAGWAVKQDVVRGLSPAPGRGEQHRQVGLDVALADVFVEAARPQGGLDHEVRFVEQPGREHPRHVLGHRSKSIIGLPISYKCSSRRFGRGQSLSSVRRAALTRSSSELDTGTPAIAARAALLASAAE